MRTLLLSLVWTSLTAIFTPGAQAQSQAEINQEAHASLDKADAELNQVYNKVLSQKKAAPAEVEALKRAQRAWLAFVEAHLNAYFYVPEGENPRQTYGSSYPAEFAAQKEAMIRTRIAQLKEFLLE
jgi:uncharacterized protein YecT (DUF1311 family)